MRIREPIGFLVLMICVLNFGLNTAWAGLGDSESKIDKDKNVFSSGDANTINPRSQNIVTTSDSYKIHDISSDGTTIKEYVNQKGTVFAVAWSGGQVDPNLSTLLGRYYSEYTKHASDHHRVRGRRHNKSQTENMVIETGGHMRNVSGKAYVPNSLPAGFSPENIN